MYWYHYRQPAHRITWLHRHDCLELGYCHAGSGVFVVEDKIQPFAAGAVAVISEREMHLATSAPGTTSRWTFIALDPARLLPAADPALVDASRISGPAFANLVAAAEDPDLAELLRGLVSELDTAGPAHRDAVRAMVWRILVHLARHHARDPSDRSADLDPLAPALALIGQCYHEPLGVGDLAAACELSESHFRRLFTTRLGIGPTSWLNRVRVQMACTLLRDPGRSILDVALEVGFGSLSAFNRQFKAELGTNPRRWRATAASGPAAGSPSRRRSRP